MKRLIILSTLFLVACSAPEERQEKVDSEGKLLSSPETMIYIYKPGGEIDTVEAYNAWTGDQSVWWDDEDGYRHYTNMPVIVEDLYKEEE